MLFAALTINTPAARAELKNKPVAAYAGCDVLVILGSRDPHASKLIGKFRNWSRIEKPAVAPISLRSRNTVAVRSVSQQRIDSFDEKAERSSWGYFYSGNTSQDEVVLKGMIVSNS
ncbi:hypothetical protein NDU88_002267 [Pleurodeles waltl]|uniref:PBP domain-containing protein n=1 Tax=Pleurodeles waltl TaxID=8319 RepID=A0AAV7T1W1_PLEWA|nr:hypothetical protein NDU88_002267 [Pleurodeles waltl]